MRTTSEKIRRYLRPRMRVYTISHPRFARFEAGEITYIDKFGNFEVIWHTLGGSCRKYNADMIYSLYCFHDFEEKQFYQFQEKVEDRMGNNDI